MATGTVMEIMKKLSIGDALIMKNNFPQSGLLQACYDERINPVPYFQESFKHPMTLMSAMFDSGCILAGPRALEYFVPGSCHPYAEWDFFVPAYKESVFDMMNALHICGVNWNDDARTVACYLNDFGKATISRRMLETLATWTTNLGEQSASHLLGRRLCDIAHAYSQRTESFNDIQTFEINEDADGNLHLIPIRQVSVDEPFCGVKSRPQEALKECN
ncbi:hypothetical protein A9Z42_0042060 [Trichoderma parareesei]|uniref:Uncharacterized protein n=1 Tax=Trichoderma parareesei TaxID=858221 RepID=A0A2H2ZCS4_TRIPA|nr:hypothetical protein A9Z42_0042060 [Trichoderma parareesei]